MTERNNAGRNASDEKRDGRLKQTIEGLAPVAASLGVDSDVQAGQGARRPTLPVLNVLKPIRELCHEAGMLVRSEGIYLQGDRIVTIDDEGTSREMCETRFVSWLPGFCLVSKGKDEDGNPRRIDLTSKRAVEILKSDIFRNLIPKLTRILPARLPVYTEDRKGVRLLPKGYDPEHEVFVTHSAPDVSEMDVDDAISYWKNLYSTFPWGDDTRSQAAQISAQVGMFVQMFFPQAQAVPLYYWNANMEGSGKSILAEIVVSPVYGHCETGDFGQGEEFLKRLMARALSYSSYFFMDDVSGFVRSQALNRWIVQAYWTDRRMHSHEEMKVPKRCMTMITGNGATLSDDLIRRAVIVDLFAEQTADERLKERGTENEVTSEWLSNPKTRSEMLSALWAMVRYWADEGMMQATLPIPSFVGWSKVVGGIVEVCGLGDPFKPAMLESGGDQSRTEWTILFEAVVRRFKPTESGVTIELPEWCAVARELGIYESKVGSLEVTRMELEENPRLWKIPPDSPFGEKEKHKQALRYMHPQKQAAPFGKLLNKKPKKMTVDGIIYQFGDRKGRKSTFKVWRLSDPHINSNQGAQVLSAAGCDRPRR